MPNMSYCRFRNTLADLRDCHEVLDEKESLSQEETKARDRLISLCIEIAIGFGYEVGMPVKIVDDREDAEEG